MRVLVTGADGFIGRHVTAHILDVTDWNVVALDVNHSVDWHNDGRVTRVYSDLTDDHFGLPDGVEVDAVVHLASVADVSAFLSAPAQLLEANVKMTLTMLEWARTQRLSHFIQVSTNEVYGPSYAGESHREWSSIIPSTPYSASKAAQESAAIAWWRTYRVPTVILTAMHVFGEGQPSERFIPQVISRLHAGLPVKVYARQVAPDRWIPARRNWLYVRDFADAVVWTLTKHVALQTERPDRWNVSGPAANLVSVVDRVARLLDVEPKFEYVDVATARPGYELVYELDNASMRVAGWNPPFGFTSGLERTVTMMRYTT